MTLSYSIGLTTGSVGAYGLDFLLGPMLQYDPCATGTPAADLTSNHTTLSNSSAIKTFPHHEQIFQFYKELTNYNWTS